jgi:WD40 repeat protein/predicted Ser/Thr protein kinase
MSIAPPICPECGSALRSRTSRGLCPQCLLKVALSGDNSDPQPVTPIATEARRFGPYELVRELGRGGMGVVYEARQIAVDRRVALKMILPAHLSSPTDVERFRLEARAVALLEHPNILPVFDVGEIQGQAYFTMKLVDGSSLARSTPDERGPRKAAQLVAQIARAVHYAHQRGVQHRDLKPGNILLDSDGRPYLADFGLAKILESDNALTLTTTTLGSPAYMSPEQARGDTKNITSATDIYSLGAILYQLLTGKPPFQGKTVYETMRQVTEEEPATPSAARPGLDRDLEIICLKCLAKDPQRRYRSAEALAEDLDRWLASEPIHARPTNPAEKLWLWSRRNPALSGLSAACLLAVVVGVAGIVLQWRRAERLALEESRLRVLADDNARQTRLNLYAADMSVAAQALARGNLGLARLTLAAHRPKPGEEDLRGFEWRYLMDQSRGQQLATLRGHSWIVTCVAFSPDGSLLASGSLDGSCKIWDCASLRLIRTIADGGISASSLAFTPDGHELMAGMAHGRVTFWNIATGEKSVSFPGRLAALSPDGNLVATAESSPFYWEKAGAVKIWDRHTGQLRGELSEPGRRPAFSRDGDLLAVAGADQGVLVWKTHTLELAYNLRTSEPVWSVVFSPTSDELVATGWNNTAIIWNLAQGSSPSARELKGHELGVWSAAFSSDGTRLATTSSDETVRLWDAATLQPQGVLRGHGNEVWCVAFSPDGKFLATGSKDKTVMLWNSRVDTPPEAIRHVDWHPPMFSTDGKWLLAHVPTGHGFATGAAVWDIASRSKTAEFPNHEPVGFSPDNKGVVTLGSRARELQYWAIDSKALVGTVHLEGQSGEEMAHYGCSPDCSRFFGIDSDGTATLWNIETGKRLGSAKGPRPMLRNAVLGPGGKFLAVSTEGEKDVHLLDLVSGTDTRLAGHEDFVSGLAFSANGKLLATGSMDGTLRLWDIARASEIATLSGHMEEVTDVCFSPDGLTLASMEKGLTTKLWHVATHRELMSLPTPLACGYLRFSPDGHTLVIVQQDQKLCVLHAPTAEGWEGFGRPEALNNF